MVLNYIWIAFFLIAFIVAVCRLCYSFYLKGNADVLGATTEEIAAHQNVFSDIVGSIFERAELGFELSIGLTGILALWLGIMKIGEKGGAIKALSWAVSPLFKSIFPSIPKNHPAGGSIVMNFCANMLGLDNAATPLGLKAMDQLQELNPKKDTASNEQIMFLVLNTSGLTIIPVSILALRTSAGSADPTSIFLPILIATFCSTLAGLITVSIIQKINLFKGVIIAYIGGGTLLMAGMIFYLSSLTPEGLAIFSQIASGGLIFTIIIGFLALAIIKKVNVYEAFIEGAKDGFNVAIKIVPYLIAMLVGIAAFTASGAMGWLTEGLSWVIAFFGFDTAFVESLPTAIMKPLSGGGARGMMVESWGPEAVNVDSFTGKLTSVLQGSTETTFYVLAVYFGSVGIKKTRYAVKAGLMADFVGIVAAIIIGYMFFGHEIEETTAFTSEEMAIEIHTEITNAEFTDYVGIPLFDNTGGSYDFGDYLLQREKQEGHFKSDTIILSEGAYSMNCEYQDSRVFYKDGVNEKYLFTIKKGELVSVKYEGNIKLEEEIVKLRQNN
ncbi:MAG: spore maturation protein SpmA [Parvicellaceae bacterium]|jgi:spore maturation protein SpmA